MFLRTRNKENVASATWNEFLHGLGSTRDVAAEKAREKAGSVRETLSGTGTEARQRASLALDALAGRPAPVRWGWVVAAAGVGVLAGLAVAELLRGHPVDEAVASLRRQLSHSKEQVQEYVG
ncbi:hypothetical protein [Catellatospora methionotrophica]|uniref:hypothetical protein n=1 Tax=Catellatospora methionotrophica TaxID=121620 RepID=UPI0033CCEDA4